MADLSPVNTSSLSALSAGLAPASPLTPAAREAASQAGNASQLASQRAQDEVELSSAATFASLVRQLPEVRQDLVDRVKREIAQGTYETPDKLDGALAELLIDLQEREHLGF